MIRFKMLKSSYYNNNLNYDYHKTVEESGDYYINKDIENFCNHNKDIKILDIYILSTNSGLIVVIKYSEKGSNCWL